MSDSTYLPNGNQINIQSQFLTVPYNPSAHPKQISLLDVNGQPIHYTLIPLNQSIPTQIVPHDSNTCSVCGSHAVAKCTYGISQGRPCGRLLCLSHVRELSGGNGGRYPHCPEHYQHIQQNKCNII